MNDVSTEQVRRATSRQYVIFCLGETRFSVEINQVLRIVRLTPITRVPKSCSTAINYPPFTIPLPVAVRCRWKRSGSDWRATPAT